MAEALSEIRALSRNLSNQNSTDIISDSDYNVKINNWYQNKLPVEVNHGLERIWRVSTLPYVENYAVPQEYVQLKGTARIDGDPLDWYLEPARFFDDYQDAYVHNSSLEAGDGSTLSFGGTLSLNDRVIPETCSFGDDLETFQDDGEGSFTGSLGGTGTIDYVTGVWALTFNTAPDDGDAISGSYGVYTSGVPQAVLYTNADKDDGGGPEIVLRPIPSGVYSVQLDYETRPAKLVNDTDVPVYLAWGDLIAYGTAIDVLESFGQLSEAGALKDSYGRILDTVHGVMLKIQAKRIKLPEW
jgi:hypothetical protein